MPPLVFTVLILPMGVSSGYVTVTLGYLLSQAGVSVEQIAGLVAASLLPHIFKFLWAPVVDSTLSYKRWYKLANVVCFIGLVATGIVPFKESSIPHLTALVFLWSLAITFLCMATEGLMAYDVPEEVKGRTGGFMQAGNLGGAGIGGGIGLILAQHLPAAWMSPVIMGVVCIACCLPLALFNDHRTTVRAGKLRDTYVNIGKDVWGTIKTRSGLLGLLLCMLTLGTGAAGNLWSSIAKDWHASAEVVALVTGIAGGLLSALGCMIGGWACDRMDSRNAYLLFGLAGAACAVAMGLAPRTEWMFIGFTSLYAVITGLSFAGFTAFTLDVIGKGAAATKYNIFAALSNSPIYLMTWVVGAAYAHFGAQGMLNTEAAFAAGAVLLFVVVQQLIYRKQGAVPSGR
ncbi:MAG: MFS transporter [Bacteroidetes bacterium]|nr:MFS transporter [Bacteroidota bacterium]MBS1942921.1 MFS transporter [Bacteroidota bacterium]